MYSRCVINFGPLYTAHIVTDPTTARERLHAMRRAVPTLWRAIIVETLRAAADVGASQYEATVLLGVSESLFYRWLRCDPELRALVQDVPRRWRRGRKPAASSRAA